MADKLNKGQTRKTIKSENFQRRKNITKFNAILKAYGKIKKSVSLT